MRGGATSGVALQWGRVLMNAETKSSPTAGLWISVLQWGRVLMNAETTAHLTWALGEGEASMGPRSHERGNSQRRPCSTEWSSCFNGAAFS